MPAAPSPAKTIRDLYAKETVTREVSLDRGGVDVNARTVPLSFSSEAPVLRYDMRGQPFWEVLDHSAVDMSRMQPGAPVLYGHDRRDHIGTVLSVGIDGDKRGRAVVKFSRGKFAQEKFDDVQDGILHATSVGYDLSGAEPVADGERDGIPIYRFRQWLPFELTLCAIPADPSVGVGRSKTEATAAMPAAPQPTRTISMSETTSQTGAAPAVTPSAVVTVDFTAERERIKSINAAAKVQMERHPEKAEQIRTLANTCNEGGKTVEQFGNECLNLLSTRTLGLAPAPGETRQAQELGLSKKEVKRYSLLRAFNDILSGKALSGLELEAHRAEEERAGRQASGFFVPTEVLYSGKRELNATGAPNVGGYTIAETIDSNYIELLRNATKVMGLGARMITGLQGNISVPRVLTGTTASWLSESGTNSATTPTFGQVVMRPRRLAAMSAVTKQFLQQSGISAEAFLRDDMFKSMAIELDRVAINGAGGAEPLGILNLASGDRSTSVTFGAAATWAKYVEFVKNLMTNNALLGTPAFLSTPGTWAKGVTIEKFSSTGETLIQNNTIAGYRFEVTNQFPTSGTTNQVIFGDFSQVVYGQWLGNDVLVDPYVLATTGQIRILVETLVDCVVRQGKAFVISTDSGAQ